MIRIEWDIDTESFVIVKPTIGLVDSEIHSTIHYSELMVDHTFKTKDCIYYEK